MGLKDIGETLPPGFRFNPRDEELICHYLHKKIANEEVLNGSLMEVDLHICEPWQLPETAKLNASEWYFFNFRDRKYATGYRTNRATPRGYWKATGKDRTIHDPNTSEVVGMRKTLVFYLHRAPNGTKTGWIMHEFRMESPYTNPKEDWVLCRVFFKNKLGEDKNTTSSPISHIPTASHNQNQNNLNPVVFSSSLPTNPTNKDSDNIPLAIQNGVSFQEYNTIPACEYHPLVAINSIFHHLGLEGDNMTANPTSFGTLVPCGDIVENDEWLRFLWELNEDDSDGRMMDIVSTLEAHSQLGLEVDDIMMDVLP